MPKPNTICAECKSEFEPKKRGRTPRFCSLACKQKAYRERHAKPVTIERLQRSQRRDDRRKVRRPNREHNSIIMDGDGPVVIEENGTRLEIGAEYAVTPTGKKIARFAIETPFPPVEDEALRRISDPYRGVLWDEIRREAVEEFFKALHSRFRQPWEPKSVQLREELSRTNHINSAPSELDRDIAVKRWFRKYLTHSNLTIEGRLEVVTRVPEDYLRVRDARDAERTKEKQMELATIAAQNEEILARIGHLREVQAEMLEKLTDTVERVRERFPNDAEVSAAVDRLLEDIS